MAHFLKKKIIIIGAGISGIASACYLKQLGFCNVQILEAQDRIGGRIHSKQFGPHYIEIGAQWIHGQKDNVIYEIADCNDLINKKCVSYMGTIESFKHLSNEKREVINLLSEKLYEKMKNITVEDNEDSSLLSYLNKHFDAFMTDYVDNPLEECLYEYYDWLCRLLCELNGCQHLSLLSKNFLNMYKECEGEPTVELKHGYHSILSLLLETIPNDWILKNSEVKVIDWCEFSNENNKSSCSAKTLGKAHNKIKVVCQNEKEYFADHVIVTLPLGVLKKKHHSMFYPNLSSRKQQAISCLGFGIVNKIYLKFDCPFWEKYFIINVLWNIKFDEHFSDEFYSENKGSSSQHWVKCINRFAYVLSHPSMLCAWVTGEGAVILESLTDDKVMRDCIKLLELLTQKNLPRPANILKSNWSSDPFTYGAYSYISIKCKSKKILHTAIAEPEYSNIKSSQHPVLLFAGEASHEYYFSTVHGAYESGVREAQRLFLYYRKQDDKSFFQNLMSVSNKIPRLILHERNWRKNVRIIIVGAGIAGLSCALQLTKNNFTNIHILEALDYTGGRVQSVKYGNDFLELGAQWIHGTENELYKFLEFHKIVPQLLDNCSCEGKGIFCTSSGNVIANDIVEEVKTVLDKVKSEIEKNILFDDKKSVFSAFSKAFESYITCCEDKSNVEVKKGLFDWYVKFEVIDNACESLDKVAVQSYAEWDDCPSEEYHINIKNGFSSIVNFLISQIPAVSLTRNKPVKTINWLKDNENKKFQSSLEMQSREFYPCSVECEDGESLSADCVIVTTSIGFLKENHHTFFVPSLPLNKCKVLENIGFGTINKFYLVYNKTFWSSNELGIHLVWVNQESDESLKLKAKHPWINGISGFDVLKKLPNILVGWIGGEEAKLIENIEDDVICSVCTEIFKLFLKNPDIPPPVEIIRSQWFNNPYVRGAYSYRTTGFYQSPTSLYDLQHPLYSIYKTKCLEVEWPLVMFAGEALDEKSFSSVHGAFHSGLSAINPLIETCSHIEIYEDM